MPHAASKGFGAPAKKQQDNGAAKKDKGRGATKMKEHGHISGTSSQVSLMTMICLPGPTSSLPFPGSHKRTLAQRASRGYKLSSPFLCVK